MKDREQLIAEVRTRYTVAREGLDERGRRLSWPKRSSAPCRVVDHYACADKGDGPDKHVRHDDDSRAYARCRPKAWRAFRARTTFTASTGDTVYDGSCFWAVETSNR